MKIKPLSGMRKPIFAITGLAAGSLFSLLLTANSSAWGSEFTISFGEGRAQTLFQRVNDDEFPNSFHLSRRTTGGGTRGGGCGESTPIGTTALAPQTVLGQTISTRPTLTWFVADEEPYLVQVRFYRYLSTDPAEDRIEPMITYDIGQSQPGYMTFTLPDDQPALAIGEIYHWKVFLDCVPSQPSKRSIARANLQVVAPPAGFVATGDPVQQAAQYEAAGLWYDAIAVLSQAPVSPAAAAFRRELVAELAEQEAANPDPFLAEFVNNLNHIAGQE